jgi:hypothetical protein
VLAGTPRRRGSCFSARAWAARRERQGFEPWRPRKGPNGFEYSAGPPGQSLRVPPCRRNPSVSALRTSPPCRLVPTRAKGSGGNSGGKMAELSFDDVMLDWAAAEALSPEFGKQYAWLGKPLLDRCAHGIDHLTPEDRSRLVAAVEKDRSPLISRSGIARTSTFRRITVSADELGAFAILDYFRFPSGTPFAQFAHKVMTNPLDAVKEAERGVLPRGHPIAVWRPSTRPLLVEGNRRSLFAFWARQPIEMFFCEPVG